MMKFLGRLLLFLIVAAGAAYLLFPIASDQYMLYGNAPRLQTYRQRAAGLDAAGAAKAKKPITDWNNRQIQEGIVPAEGSDRRAPWISEGELARLAEQLGAEPPGEQKSLMKRLLSPEDEGMSPRVVRELIRRFAQANGAIQPLQVQDPFTAASDGAAALLFTDRNGVTGILEIPRIGVTLPVYSERSADRLETGLFRGPGSSLPIGGAGTHALLAGSGGLPAPDFLNDIGLKGPKMLEDMKQLVQGDIFLFTAMNQTLLYRIDEINTIPAGSAITLERSISADRMTIVSAPREGGRLAVRGTRIEPEENSGLLLKENAAAVPEDWVKIVTFAAPVLLLGLLVMFIIERFKKRRYRLPTEEKKK